MNVGRGWKELPDPPCVEEGGLAVLKSEGESVAAERLASEGSPSGALR